MATTEGAAPAAVGTTMTETGAAEWTVAPLAVKPGSPQPPATRETGITSQYPQASTGGVRRDWVETTDGKETYVQQRLGPSLNPHASSAVNGHSSIDTYPSIKRPRFNTCAF